MNRIQITKICPLCEKVAVLPEGITPVKINPPDILQFISCRGCIFKYDNTLDERQCLEKQKVLSMIASNGQHHNIACEYIDNDSMRAVYMFYCLKGCHKDHIILDKSFINYT